MATRTDDIIELGAGENAALTRMPVRVYGRRSRGEAPPLVLHLHAGAFVRGSLETGQPVATLLAEAGAIVVAADYPLAPKHVFPAALRAVFGALTALHHNRSRWASRKSQLFVAGEEAGGNLAAGLALVARDRQPDLLAGQILLSPMLDPAMGTCSIRSADAGPVGCQWADGWHQYLGSPEKAAHPYAAPLNSIRLAGLAPALVLTAQDDPMRDESQRYARRLRESGVPVQHDVLAGPTEWPCALARSDRARAPWSAAVHEHFVTFFAATAASWHSASALHAMPA
jgi:acetyl esterase/lipase